MDRSDDSISNKCPDGGTSLAGGIPYSSDITRRWEKINADMRQIQVTGVQGTSISAVYANTSTRRSIPPDQPLPIVGFSCMTKEPTDDEIPHLVDDAIAQVLGPRGLSEIIKQGDRVVIKVNIVGPS